MRLGFALASLVVVAVVLGGPASGKSVVRTCPASPVDGNYVHAGVIRGAIDPETDVVDGRFRLHVGEYRDLGRGIFQKILWSIPSNRKRIGGRLVVRGRTLFGPKRTFVQRFNRAYADDTTQAFYPSTIVPPNAGCWKLALTTGKLHNALVARVDG